MWAKKQMTKIESIPKLLDLPDKLLPILTGLNKYSYFLIEGGRGGGKSQAIARIIIWICEKRTVRVCCGRETQNTIENSVYKILVDIIKEFELDFTVRSNRIIHKKTNSEIFFIGFKEQGRVNIKGLEGVDILWIDEAEAITKATLDIIVPTIRKKNALVFFTMNRFVRKDAVFVEFANDVDCLHIKINYYDNKFCPTNLIKKALKCKEKNPKDYYHIWEGNPKDQAGDFLVNSRKLDKSQNIIFPVENYMKIRAMAVDLSGCGGDFNVATLLESKSTRHFEATKQEFWNEPDTDITKGKIISLYSIWHPNILILDADGLGYPIYISVKKAITKCIGFKGAAKSIRENCANQRADGYLTLKEFIDNEWLKIPFENVRNQLEYIKKVHKPNGTIMIQAKKEMREETGESPDFADSLMMAVWGVNYHSNLANSYEDDETIFLKDDYDPFE